LPKAAALPGEDYLPRQTDSVDLGGQLNHVDFGGHNKHLADFEGQIGLPCSHLQMSLLDSGRHLPPPGYVGGGEVLQYRLQLTNFPRSEGLLRFGRCPESVRRHS
jgi:hypothetical protein